MRKRFVLGLLGSLAAAACQGGEAPADPAVAKARISLPAVPSVPGAGYFVVKGGDPGDALVGVNSPAAERIEMHETASDARGITIMRPITEAPLGRAEGLTFAPGGRHLMVYGLRDDLAAGATIPLTFRFRSAPPITAEARLLPPGAGAHDGH